MSIRSYSCGLALAITGVMFPVIAEKELMYDPVKGIIFVEKGKNSSSGNGVDKGTSSQPVYGKSKSNANRSSKTSGLHVGRKKDPPELYFKSGLEYFKNGDYNNALKNFTYANALEHRAEFSLFIGQTLRNLGKKNEMIKVMFDILKDEPDCDVADDALLELALLYKVDNDYEKSMQLFTRLIEQYPFSTVYSTGEELPVLAREQRRVMRAEMINLLTTLGYSGGDLKVAFQSFQKTSGLEQSGVGDLETVSALKNAHRQYLSNEYAKAENMKQIDQFKGWMYGAIAAGSINIILLMFLLLKAQAHKKQVAELMSVISELNVKNI